MVIHQLDSLVSELSVNGIFLLLVYLDLHILLDVIPLGNILILAKGVDKRRGLAEDIVLILGTTKSALDRFEKRHNFVLFLVCFVLLLSYRCPPSLKVCQKSSSNALNFNP